MSLAVDTRASLVLETFVFRKETWDREGERILPGTPGSWFDVRRMTGKPKGVLAFYRCPACLAVMALHKRVHRIDVNGHIAPDLVCSNTAAKCTFHRKAYLDRWSNKPLYAGAIVRKTAAGEWVGEMHYCHAADEREARFHFGNLGGDYRIDAVAPVIGYFAEDREGKVVSA